MGNPKVAAALRKGTEAAIAQFGEPFVFTRKGQSGGMISIDGTQSASQDKTITLDCSITNVMDHLIDGNVIRKGDKIILVPGGKKFPDSDEEFVPKLSDLVENEDITYTISQISPTRVAGKNVSFQVFVR